MIKLKKISNLYLNDLIDTINEYYSTADDVQILIDNTEYNKLYIAIIKYKGEQSD